MRNAMVREPTHPGIFLKEDYMVPLGLSQAKVAKLLHVNKRTIHELCTQKRGTSAVMALNLEKLYGLEAQFWLSAQNSYNIWLARQKYEDVLKIDIEEFKRICKQDKKDI